MIVKGKKEEKDLIIQEIDNAFQDDSKEEVFSIAKEQPQAYGKGVNTSESHFLYEENGEILAVVGNLLGEIKIQGKTYHFGRVGSVSTKKGHRGKGLMTALLDEVEKEDREKGTIFSILTGKRERYGRKGYENGPVSFIFEFSPTSPSDYFHLLPFEEKYLPEAFSFYQKNDPYQIRTKETFLRTLGTEKGKPYLILREGKIAGYLSLKDDMILELAMEDLSHLKDVLGLFPSKKVSLYCNSLNFPLIQACYREGGKVFLYQREMIRVYRPKEFLEMLDILNHAKRRPVSLPEPFDSRTFVSSLFPDLKEATLSDFAYFFDLPFCDLF